MDIYGFNAVGPVHHKDSSELPEQDGTIHKHDNGDILGKFSLTSEGVLLYDGKPIGGGSSFENEEVLAKLAENSKGKLSYNGGTISGGSTDLAVNVAGRIDEAITARILLVRETTLPALLAGSKVMCLTPPTTPFEIRLSYYNQGVSTEFAVVTIGVNGQGVFSNLPQAPIVLPEGAFISVPAAGMVGNGAQDLLVALKTGD